MVIGLTAILLVFGVDIYLLAKLADALGDETTLKSANPDQRANNSDCSDSSFCGF